MAHVGIDNLLRHGRTTPADRLYRNLARGVFRVGAIATDLPASRRVVIAVCALAALSIPAGQAWADHRTLTPVSPLQAVLAQSLARQPFTPKGLVNIGGGLLEVVGMGAHSPLIEQLESRQMLSGSPSVIGPDERDALMSSFVTFLREHFAFRDADGIASPQVGGQPLSGKPGQFGTGQRTSVVRRSNSRTTPAAATAAAGVPEKTKPGAGAASTTGETTLVHTATTTPAPPVSGDINGDGNVSHEDLALFDRGLVNYESGTIAQGAATLTDGDANGDGAVNIADYVLICTALPGAGNNPGDLPTAPILIPGAGFTGPTEQPAAAGMPDQSGYDAMAIARWDVVPYQTFDGLFNVGVTAFHMNGIDRVEFSVNSGTWVPVRTVTLNSQTRNDSGIGSASDGVFEYWLTLDADQFVQDGSVEVRAIAYPTVGVPRVLDGLTLFANGQGTFTSNKVYVSQSGNDSAPGTADAPVRTIHQAIRNVRVGGGANAGEIILAEPGFYELPNYATGNDGQPTSTLNERWLTIKAADGLTPDQVILGRATRSNVRARVQRMRLEGVSLDFATISQVYTEDTTSGSAVWFDRCRWFTSDTSVAQSNYPVRSIGGRYVTRSTAIDVLYGFVGMDLARNVKLTNVRGDSLASSVAVINAEVSGVTGTGGSDFHSDILQYSGGFQNVIVFGVKAWDLKSVQVLFLEPTIYSSFDKPQATMRDVAFVNLDIRYEADPGSPPYSQMLSRFEHVLFKNVQMPLQRLILRTDITSNQAWYAKNLVFEATTVFNGLPSNLTGVIVR